jgi:hypothetical protein
MADESTNWYDMLSPALGLGLGAYNVYNQYGLGNQAEKGYQNAVNASQPFQYQGPSPGYAASQVAGKQGMEDYYAQMGLGTSGAMGKAEFDYGQRGINDDYWKQVNAYNQDRTAKMGALGQQGQFYGNAAGQGAGQNPFSAFTSGNNASQYAALIKQIFGGGGSQPGVNVDPTMQNPLSTFNARDNMQGMAQQADIQGSSNPWADYSSASEMGMNYMPAANSFYDTGTTSFPTFGSSDSFDFGGF